MAPPGRRQLRRRKQVALLQSAEASVSSHTRGVSTTTVLIPVGDEPEMLDGLEEFGLRPHRRALRFPTLGELRTAARSTKPDQHGRALLTRYVVRVSLLRLEHSAPGHPRDDGGGFELNAEVDPLDGGSVVTSVGFRGRHEKMDAVAEATLEAVAVE